ncbi:hypothetical protein L208DRAFT_1402116 [Tricholoma matsutake]|nr:hypothetical protein L208DRAFT_1402116 [Tricholoma matsutake 945]
MTDNHSSAGRLAFPPPGTQADNAAVPAPSLNVEGSSIKLNDLGPMIVNSDGVSVTYISISFSLRHRASILLSTNRTSASDRIKDR